MKKEENDDAYEYRKSIYECRDRSDTPPQTESLTTRKDLVAEQPNLTSNDDEKIKEMKVSS
jgi:hypothetical protein